MLLVVIFLSIIAVSFFYIATHVKLGILADSWAETGWGIIAVILLISIFCAVVAIPISRWADTDFVKKVEAIQLTVDEQRESGVITEYERATITQKIIETNETIAYRKNANKFYRLRLWTHPDIIKLQPIK